MTTTFVDHRRPWLSMVNLLLAVAAVVIAVIALALARDETTVPAGIPGAGQPTAVRVVAPLPYYGCDQRMGATRC